MAPASSATPWASPWTAKNTFDASPTGVHLALPSGDGLPGGNFYFFYETDVISPADILGAQYAALQR